MLGSLLNIFRIPDLRRKLGITAMLVMVYRIGAHVPCPFLDTERLAEFASGFSGSRSLFSMVDMFSGGGFKNMSIFALGIMPYITASIIIQLLTVVVPRLEKLAKEGEAGRKKINQITRYGTIGLAAFQSIGLAVGVMLRSNLNLIDSRFLFIVTTMIAMTTGTAFIMWLGEKITDHGIGNGISLIIAAGIIAGYPTSLRVGIGDVGLEKMAPVWLVIVPALFVLMTVVVIVMQTANRKIPIQYARRMIGRKETMGGSNFLPLKLNQAGVIPVIFSSSILMFPSFIFSFFSGATNDGFMAGFGEVFSRGTPVFNLYAMMGLESSGVLNLLKMGNVYNLAYAVLTIFFCYFYTAIQFNPIDTADNLKRSGAFIPGYRPGKNTSDHIEYVLERITLVGSCLLVFIALSPDLLAFSFGVSYTFADLIGGTGLIIVAGVMLDLMNQIQSQLLMRHYEGFKYRSRGGGSGARRGAARGPARGTSSMGGRTMGGGRSGRR